MQNKKKWIHKRHFIITDSLRPFFALYLKLAYNVKIEKYPVNGRQYLIIMNHQTAYDQFLVGAAFNTPVYYIASEDLFSNGWISKLLTWVVAPIPIKKQTTDMRATLTSARVAKEGGTIAVAPEGNRTFSGRTEYFKPSIVKLVRLLRLPLAIFRIEDGYGVHPRWSDVIRRGSMRAYVKRVIEREEYKALSDDELFELIQSELYVDESYADKKFFHKKNAEYLERAMYVCPYCGLSNFESHGDIIECKKCGRQIRYLPTKELEGVGFRFPFRFISGWYDHQSDFIRALDLKAYNEAPMYKEKADLYEVILYQNKHLIKENADIELYGDRFVFGDLVLPFDEISVVTVLGKNKLNVYHGEKLYQLKSGKRFNALKYVNIFYHYMNIAKGDPDGKFLGL